MGLTVGFITSQKQSPGGGAITPAAIAAALGYMPAPLSFWNEEDINPEFIIEASAIVQASGAFSQGNPITWNILNRSTGHGYSFFNGIDSTGTDLIVKFPDVRTVLNGVAIIDETGSGNGQFAGTGVSFNGVQITSTILTNLSTLMVADGLGNWTNDSPGVNTFINYTQFGVGFGLNPGETGINFTSMYISPFSYPGIIVTYQGGLNFLVNRRHVGIPNAIVFSLIDAATGAPLLVNPVAGERVGVSSVGTVYINVRQDVWVPSNAFMAGSSFNYWILGRYEVWMFATNVTSTENIVRYQTNVPGATVYKLFRDTSPGFGTQVLIHTGVTGVFIDTGLTAATQYYYKLVATIAGIDTDITTWAIRTRA